MNNLAENYLAMGRHAEALEIGTKTLALRRAKLGNDHRETLWSMQIVADSYIALGRCAEAAKLYAELLEAWENNLGPDHRENGQRLNQLAWQLAVCTDPEVRDPRRAVALAERAVKLAPEAGPYWQTLGVAQYRAGDWKAALAALDKSISLGNGGADRCLDWYFLAMAEWQMGNNDAARAWYEKAIEWMDKNDAAHEKLIHCRAEAADVLGVSDPPDSADRSSQP
jgi:tetratricopeptide (TPR) repeat protein